MKSLLDILRQNIKTTEGHIPISWDIKLNGPSDSYLGRRYVIVYH